MAVKPLRMLHAANLRLDCPLQHITALQEDVRDIVENASLAVFDRLVSLAIERDVDALLITGNSFDASVASCVTLPLDHDTPIAFFANAVGNPPLQRITLDELFDVTGVDAIDMFY